MSPQRAWCLFDWAGQPFYTLVLTFVFAPYFAASVASDPVTGQAIWSNTITVAGLSMALLAPVLGAIADHAGPRKPWIAVFSGVFVLGAVGLWGAVPDMASALPILVLFALAYFGAEIAFVFYSAMLPSLADRAEIGHLSGKGYAWGYVAGILSLILVLGFLAPMPNSDTTLLGLAPAFGLDPDLGEPQRATGPLAALWFVLFAIPVFVFVPDTPRKAQPGSAIRGGLSALGTSLKRLPQQPSLSAFLLGSMLYRDALAGVYIFGGIYAAGVLGWQTFQLGVFGILAALVAAMGAWLGGRADRAYGPKPVVVLSVIALILVCIVTLSTSRSHVLGVAVAPSSTLPDTVFYICGALIGGFGGALQAASRTLLVFQAEGRMSPTQAFGLYALSGKATAFLAPLLIGLATTLSGDQAWGISPVIGLFAGGLALLVFVKSNRE